MMQKPILAADATTLRVVIVTMDAHVAGATERAGDALSKTMPGLQMTVHSAAQWGQDPAALVRCQKDIEQGDIIIATMLFLEDHFLPLLPMLKARREECDAMVCIMSAGEVTKLTRMGRLDMEKPASGPMALLKKLRGKKEKTVTAGAAQMKMLRRVPQMLRFVPGTAQDVRAWMLTMQYWLAGSEDNMVNMVTALVSRYAKGSREALRPMAKVIAPISYPEVGVYHPHMAGLYAESVDALPKTGAKGTVGILLLRSYLLAGNAHHYDGVIAALEARGLKVIPAFSSGLDGRPAVAQFFMKDDHPTIDALVSLTGFSMVGGPAYNDARAAEEVLVKLDVPYITVCPVEFQTLSQWESSDQGLMPVEATMMVALPELDGGTGPMVFGGRGEAGMGRDEKGGRDMRSHAERANMLAARVARLIALRRVERAQRKVAIVLFNFPPNAGNIGTAAYLGVFESLFNTLRAMKNNGYQVELPVDIDALREKILFGNAAQFGANANVLARVPLNDHIRRERHLAEIESQWGPAPGRQQSDGTSIHVLGANFGNVIVTVQPSFGYEGDPMRLLFEKNFAPTHAFTAFYRYISEDFAAHAVLHFGTHGALEFMPGKQSGLSAACWPDRLIGDLPNIYLYASNNPSEGLIAKRRAAATLISYLTPPVAQAGLYRGLIDLKSSIERWRGLAPDASSEKPALAGLIQAQAAALNMAEPSPLWTQDADTKVRALTDAMLELEYTLIPHGLHVVGEAPNEVERTDMLMALAEAKHNFLPGRAMIAQIAAGKIPFGLDDAHKAIHADLAAINTMLSVDTEIEALLRALDGKFIRPAPGGDILRNSDVLPTGRNVHGFDPFCIPSAFAVADGARQAARILDRYMSEGNDLPKTIAMVLWGTDNLKSEGGAIAQALALMGTKPRFDSYGRLAGASLIPLSELCRPRIDVMITLSGIFRDLLPLQTKLLAEAAFMAASADEPLEMNFIRAHALAYQAKEGCDLETASLRVFGNAEGAYGANVNNLVESSRWDDGDELAETYTRRKGFAYGRAGKAMQQPNLLKSVLAGVDLAYQNLDSVELGVTTVDNYFDTLGGISRAVKRERGSNAPVYIGDQTRGEGIVRSLNEQVALETRTRMLNPKWYEGMLKHGYEGVRQIETHVTNTMGWSATTGQVEPWVYQQLSETFVLDETMRARLSELNPTASLKVANRLIEAHERNYWKPDQATLDALRRASEELEDRLEGVKMELAA